MTLFDLPEPTSPRLRWMRKHRIRTNKVPAQHPRFGQWVAWIDDRKWQKKSDSDFYGANEEEAIVNLAKQLNIKLWNEPQTTKKSP